MSSLKLIRDFRAPVDEATATELRRQLGQLEQNVSDMGDQLTKEAAKPLDVLERERSKGGLILSPGSAAGFSTAAGDVRLLLGRPRPGDKGKFTYLWSPDQANHLVIAVEQGAKINGVDQTTVSMATRFTVLIFCDGEGYWVD